MIDDEQNNWLKDTLKMHLSGSQSTNKMVDIVLVIDISLLEHLDTTSWSPFTARIFHQGLQKRFLPSPSHHTQKNAFGVLMQLQNVKNSHNWLTHQMGEETGASRLTLTCKDEEWIAACTHPAEQETRTEDTYQLLCPNCRMIQKLFLKTTYSEPD